MIKERITIFQDDVNATLLFIRLRDYFYEILYFAHLGSVRVHDGSINYLNRRKAL